jgi:hypothetical protein
MIDVPVETFVSVFRESIRVIFDWDRFLRERWPIKLSVLSRQVEINDWYLPWNVGHSGQIVRYDAPDAHPIQLADVSAVFPLLDPERQMKITDIKRSFFRYPGGGPTPVVVATYHLGSSRHLLLDGNHRIAGILLAQVPFRAVAFSVYGPIERSIVPELKHWEKGAL